MKYRIQEKNGKYRVQYRYRWWPFWLHYKVGVQLRCPNCQRVTQWKEPKAFDSLEEARDVMQQLYAERNPWTTIDSIDE